MGRMLVWQIGVWFFGLLLLVLMVAARSASTVSDLQQYLDLIWQTGRSDMICYSLMVVGYALYLTVGFNSVVGNSVSMRQVRRRWGFGGGLGGRLALVGR